MNTPVKVWGSAERIPVHPHAWTARSRGWNAKNLSKTHAWLQPYLSTGRPLGLMHVVRACRAQDRIEGGHKKSQTVCVCARLWMCGLVCLFDRQASFRQTNRRDCSLASQACVSSSALEPNSRTIELSATMELSAPGVSRPALTSS